MQKVYVQVPDKDGKIPEGATSKKVAVMFLGSRSNHALGLFVLASRTWEGILGG